MSTPERTLTLLGFDHLSALAVTVIVTIGSIVALRLARGTPASMPVRRIVCLGLAVVTFGSLVAGDLLSAYRGNWQVKTTLPLHLCDLAGMACTAALCLVASRSRRFTGSARGTVDLTQRAYELAYFWGIGGTVQALLTPEIRAVFPSFDYLQFFGLHGGIVATAFVLTLGVGLRPVRGAFWRTWIITFSIATLIFLLNLWLGSNYMYLAGPPQRASLYDVLPPWPYAVIFLVLIATVIFLVLYAPFWWMDQRRARRREQRKPGSVPAAA